MVLHGRDSKLTAAVDADLAQRDVEVSKSAFRSPDTNATLSGSSRHFQQECLDQSVIFGDRHFNHLVAEWVKYYPTERPHQAKDNELLEPGHRPMGKTRKGKAVDRPTLRDIHCGERLGGLLKHYYHQAA